VSGEGGGASRAAEAAGERPLVGIVIASHSAPVADGLVDMALQMAREQAPDVRVIAAGGASDGSLGEDPTRIAEAIARADAGAGVVVVVDFNGAVHAARFAVDTLLEPALAGRVRISGGPLVEGAVFAAVQASVGDDLEAVLATAEASASYDKHVAD
jgi:phosphoenolpyruvate---glycerone phosphotransferase subunit DhaM